jgi:DNA-binding phage protein
MTTPSLPVFDVADYLDNDELIAEYLSAAADDPNPDVFLAAISDVAKARGMALSVGSQPRYETVAAVLRALGVKFSVVTVGE